MTGQMGHRGGSGDGGRWDLDGGLGLGGERCRVSNTGYYGLEGIRGDWGGGGRTGRLISGSAVCFTRLAVSLAGVMVDGAIGQLLAVRSRGA